MYFEPYEMFTVEILRYIGPPMLTLSFPLCCLTCLISLPHLPSKDARLPVQLQRAMAAEAEAAREARAKVIAAEGEQKASKSLALASNVMAESSAALQLRYLQVRQNTQSHQQSESEQITSSDSEQYQR